MSEVLDMWDALDIKNKEEALSGNRLIHEKLMGGKHGYHPLFGEGYYYEGEDVIHFNWGSSLPFIPLDVVGFNTNWNWMMKALAKLKNKYPQPPQWKWGDEVYKNVFNSVFDNFSIHLTFLFLVDFIQESEKHTT